MPNEDSDQPVPLLVAFWIQQFFMWTMKTDQTVQMTDVQADLSLCWGYMSESTFTHIVAHLCIDTLLIFK